MLLGEFEHTIDDKGRLALPAKFRPELNNGLIVTRGLERCLILWPLPEWSEISQKLLQLSPMEMEARRIHRFIFSSAVDTAPDRMGRILLPAYLREYAELQSSVALIGVLNRVEIWSRVNWEAERAQAEQESAQIAQHLFGRTG